MNLVSFFTLTSVVEIHIQIEKECEYPRSTDKYMTTYRDSLPELLYSFVWKINILSVVYADWDLLHSSLRMFVYHANQ